jgi:Peptidase M15
MPRRLFLVALIPALAVLLWLVASPGRGNDRGAAPGVATASAGGPPGDGAIVTDALGKRARPQAIQPTAGVAAASSASDSPTAPSSAPDSPTATPVGDPTAHARSLADVRRELRILNLCGGAISNALAQPLVTTAGFGFVADPGTTQDVGVLPVLIARLDALGRALHVTIYGISGYRTPAHSVAVGGLANDPHTKGEAEDIGVNSLLRSSAAQISETMLARYGLYRPFDPSDDPANSEVNHIQLIPSGGPLSLAQASSTWRPDPRCR